MKQLTPIATFSSPSLSRSWHSAPHPTLPLLASASSDKTVRIYSLQTYQLHSTLEGGHKRSVRSVAWKPNLPSTSLSLVTGSFDATAGIWRRAEAAHGAGDSLETEITHGGRGGDDGDEEDEAEDWEFSLVLEGHDSEIKAVTFSPSGQYLATCSRDKSVWIWEEIGAEGEDEWETVAVLQEHGGDVKCLAWCPDDDGNGECLASGSYDDTVRIWREDGEGEWGAVATLEGHTGTVWAVDWEGKSKSEEGENQVKSPRRLISCSADNTIRVWRLNSPSSPAVASNGIPSTMRPAASGEDWVCESTLPAAHSRAILSVAWSKKSGRVVSTGSDSDIIVYEEVETDGKKEWQVIAKQSMGHGPYEINHVIWTPRYDGGRKGEEEMVVSTGDDGVVMAWAVDVN